MPVQYLELENFKSYGGNQRIGPFGDFTCVVGPNGSGKSNLMDGLSFVLGLQSKDLRSKQLKDLIHRGVVVGKDDDDVDASSPGLHASATLVYVKEDKDDRRINKNGNNNNNDNDDESSAASSSASDGGDGSNNKELRFSRRIRPDGTSTYHVNRSTVSFKQYQQRLADIGVLLKVRNFLVFQGDVESLARKDPSELTALFEQISNSASYKPEYDAALQAKETTSQEIVYAMQKSKNLKLERKLLKEQKDEAEKFRSLQVQYADTKRDLYLWQIYHIERDRDEKQATLVEVRQELASNRALEEQAHTDLKEAKKEASAARRATTQADKKRVNLSGKVEELEPSLVARQEEIKSLSAKLKQDESLLGRKRKDVEKHVTKLEALDTEIGEYRATLTELERDYEEMKKAAADVTLTEEQEEEYARVREAVAAAIAEPKRKAVHKQRALDNARAVVSQKQQELEQATALKSEAAKDVNELRERKDKLTNGLETTSTELSETEKEMVAIQKEEQQARVRRDKLDMELEKIDNQLRQVDDTKKKTNDEKKMQNAVSSLKSRFPGVHGRLLDLCRPTQRKYNLAVTVRIDPRFSAYHSLTYQGNTEIYPYR